MNTFNLAAGFRARRPVALLAIVLPAAVMLTGCGQTGDLYFTEDPPADQLPPSLKYGGSPIPTAPVGGAIAPTPFPENPPKEQPSSAPPGATPDAATVTAPAAN